MAILSQGQLPNVPLPRPAPRNRRRSVGVDRLVERRELLLVASLLAFYGLWAVAATANDYWLINIGGPIALAAILLAGAWWQTRSTPRAIWQPLFWFRIACAAYYGVGALAPYIGNDVTAAYIRALYNFSDVEAFKVGAVNVIGILIVLAAAFITGRSFAWKYSVHAPVQSNSLFRILAFATVLLVGGGIIRYFVVLPWTLGLISDVQGIVIPLARSYNIGLYLLVLGAMRGSRFAMLLAVILVPIDLAVSLLTFAKNHVLLTLIFVCLGILQDRISTQRVFFGFALVVGIYAQLDPIVHYGRNELQRQNGGNIGSLQQRIEILNEYSSAAWQGTHREELQSWLLRLSYVNAASLVIDWYDTGRPGESFKNAFVVLVPRVIWPDKPVITAVGSDLYLAATGLEGSSISPGLFAEAYWNFGWVGLPLLMVPLGMILAIFSHYSHRIMTRERLLHFPAVLLGVIIGYRVDGWYVADIVGGCGTALVYVLVASTLEGVVLRPKKGGAY